MRLATAQLVISYLVQHLDLVHRQNINVKEIYFLECQVANLQPDRAGSSLALYLGAHERNVTFHSLLVPRIIKGAKPPPDMIDDFIGPVGR